MLLRVHLISLVVIVISDAQFLCTGPACGLNAPRYGGFPLQTPQQSPFVNVAEMCCNSSNVCLPGYKFCDQRIHCPSAEDETETLCGAAACELDQMQCPGTILCVSKCDFLADCPRGEDELLETCAYLYENTTHCDPDFNLVSCPGGFHQCINHSMLCDGEADCPFATDELNCENFTCGVGKVACTNPRSLVTLQGSINVTECIKAELVCDYKPNCADASDELSCTQIPPDNFMCEGKKPYKASTGLVMLPEVTLQTHVCDGDLDCFDGSDELNCPFECDNTTHFLCKTPEVKVSGQGRQVVTQICVNKSQICDNYINCPDESDEVGCPIQYCTNDGHELQCTSECDNTTHFRCIKPDYKTTLQGTIRFAECINAELVCDYKPNCADASDELSCTQTPPPDKFMCEGKKSYGASTGPVMLPQVIQQKNVCDGDLDCLDGSDELNCASKCDNTTHFLCTNPLPRTRFQVSINITECINAELVCDGNLHCSDGSDELNCASKCDKTTHFLCTNPRIRTRLLDSISVTECISAELVCDGYLHCFDGSDELNCTSKCDNITHFLCKTPVVKVSEEGREIGTQKCVEISRICDYDYDCPDHSDEVGCPIENCTNGFSCPSGRCIPLDYVCDGYSQCNIDGTIGADEKNCTMEQCALYGKFKCSALKVCVPQDRRCDRYTDCDDSSDEKDCTNYDCSDAANYVICGEGFPALPNLGDPFLPTRLSRPLLCASVNQTCDRINDCSLGEDEVHCTAEAYKPCPEEHFACNGGAFCVHNVLRCNYYNDCTDGSDEANCTSRSCPPGLVSCPNDEKCVPAGTMQFYCN